MKRVAHIESKRRLRILESPGDSRMRAFLVSSPHKSCKKLSTCKSVLIKNILFIHSTSVYLTDVSVLTMSSKNMFNEFHCILLNYRRNSIIEITRSNNTFKERADTTKLNYDIVIKTVRKIGTGIDRGRRNKEA